MEIIEKFIIGKKEPEALCEDMLFINDDFVVVVDGVSSKSNRLFGGKTGGRAAAEKICEAVNGFSSDIDAFEAVEKMTESVASLYNDDEKLGDAAAGVIILSLNKNEIWSVGDCQCIINGEKFLHEKEIDSITGNMRAAVLQIAINEGATEEELMEHDIGREYIMPILKKQHSFANIEGKFDYAVLNGTPVPEKLIVIHKVKLGDTVILSSDGYPVLCETLQESEEALKHELENDPLCFKSYISTKGISKGAKSFDDRTYIKLIV